MGPGKLESGGACGGDVAVGDHGVAVGRDDEVAITGVEGLQRRGHEGIGRVEFVEEIGEIEEDVSSGPVVEERVLGHDHVGLVASDDHRLEFLGVAAAGDEEFDFDAGVQCFEPASDFFFDAGRTPESGAKADVIGFARDAAGAGEEGGKEKDAAHESRDGEGGTAKGREGARRRKHGTRNRKMGEVDGEVWRAG